MLWTQFDNAASAFTLIFHVSEPFVDTVSICQIARFSEVRSICRSHTMNIALLAYGITKPLRMSTGGARLSGKCTTTGTLVDHICFFSNSITALTVVKLYRRRSIPGLLPYFGSNAQQSGVRTQVHVPSHLALFHDVKDVFMLHQIAILIAPSMNDQ